MKLLRFFTKEYKFFLYFILGGISSFSSCADPNGENNFDPAVFDHQIKTISRSYQDCDLSDPSCTYVSLSYPEFNIDSEEVNKISSRIKEVLLGDADKDPSIFCQEFIDEYASFVKEDFGDEEYERAWYSASEVEFLSIQKRVISVSISQDNFQGGAHPNLYINLLNFDPYSGESISYDQIFSKESQKELLNLLDHQLRKQKGLKKGDSLNEAGFMLDDDELMLSENFAFADEGLMFIYNSYEIAPYAMGTISIYLPYSLVIHLFE